LIKRRTKAEVFREEDADKHTSLNDKNVENEMGQACVTYRRRKKCIQDFGKEIRGKEITWKNEV
jgi:hypothetical protein